jgi:hypothetical protein
MLFWLAMTNVGASQDSGINVSSGHHSHYGVMVASLTDGSAPAASSDAPQGTDLLGVIGGGSRPKPLDLTRVRSTKPPAPLGTQPASTTKPTPTVQAKPANRYLHNDPWYVRSAPNSDSASHTAAKNAPASQGADPISAVARPTTAVNFDYPADHRVEPSTVSVSDRSRILPSLWSVPARKAW